MNTKKLPDVEVKTKFTEFIKRKIGKMEVEIGIFPSEVPDVEVEYIEPGKKGEIKRIIFTPKDEIDNSEKTNNLEPEKKYEDENIIIYTDPLDRFIREIIIKKSNVEEVEISIKKYSKEIEEQLENFYSDNPEKLKEAKYLDYKDRQLKLAEHLLEGE